MTLTQNQKTYLVLVAVMLAITAAGLIGSHWRTTRLATPIANDEYGTAIKEWAMMADKCAGPLEDLDDYMLCAMWDDAMAEFDNE